MGCRGCLFSLTSFKSISFLGGKKNHWKRGKEQGAWCIVNDNKRGKVAISRANSVHGLWRTSERKEKEWRKPKVSRQASPSQSVYSVQLADLVTSARGGGGIERGRGGERERRRRRGSSVDRRVAVCGIGTLGGSWRGRGWLNHPWQWSARLRRCGEKDKVEGARP